MKLFDRRPPSNKRPLSNKRLPINFEKGRLFVAKGKYSEQQKLYVYNNIL